MKNSYVLKQEATFDEEMLNISLKGIVALVVALGIANYMLQVLAGLRF